MESKKKLAEEFEMKYLGLMHYFLGLEVWKSSEGTIDFGLYYDNSHEYRLYGYRDADWARSISDRKITSGGCYSLGSAMISWFS